ncbi:unnamed protein product [Rotaria socialis]|uniref:Uncharacterized protein n=1 Tax=Rotaria socialis TaxID=392032 RepID=A0A821QDL5_9BILA|nr:unnamed protein product [Rotaria socialis]CAF4820119.1 unnamed protein product [Rotaria socialis]CAF4837678.1 unnamed protein product [Rotaria socialis]
MLSDRENIHRMRCKLVENNEFNKHEEASRLRDNLVLSKSANLANTNPLNLPLATPIQQRRFSQLTIRKQNGYDLKTILLICSTLIYLDFSCDNEIPPFIFSAGCFPSMKCLRLGRIENFFFHNGQFNFLLSLFPNLLQFYFTADQCREHVEIINFREIADYLRYQCPLLKIIILRIYMQECTSVNVIRA